MINTKSFNFTSKICSGKFKKIEIYDYYNLWKASQFPLVRFSSDDKN